MYDGNKIIPGLIIFLGIMTYPLWHNTVSGKTGYIPKPKAPADQKECIEPKAFIRVNHKALLEDWRTGGRSQRNKNVSGRQQKDIQHEPDEDLHELSQRQGGILRSMPHLCRGDE